MVEIEVLGETQEVMKLKKMLLTFSMMWISITSNRNIC